VWTDSAADAFWLLILQQHLLMLMARQSCNPHMAPAKAAPAMLAANKTDKGRGRSPLLVTQLF